MLNTQKIPDKPTAPTKHLAILDLDVSENRCTPKSSILIGFSIINHPFWGTPIFGNIHLKTDHVWRILSVVPSYRFPIHLKNMRVKWFTPRAATLNIAMLFLCTGMESIFQQGVKKYAIVELLSQSRGEHKTYL